MITLESAPRRTTTAAGTAGTSPSPGPAPTAAAARAVERHGRQHSGADQTASATCTDLAGNTACDTVAASTSTPLPVDRPRPRPAPPTRRLEQRRRRSHLDLHDTVAPGSPTRRLTLAARVPTSAAAPAPTTPATPPPTTAPTSTSTSPGPHRDLRDPAAGQRPRLVQCRRHRRLDLRRRPVRDAPAGDSVTRTRAPTSPSPAPAPTRRATPPRDTVAGINIDTTDPVIDRPAQPAANAAGWNNGDVTVTWACTDALSGPANAGELDRPRRGRRPVRHRHLHRQGGQHRPPTVNGINVDLTAPSSRSPQPVTANAAGWNNGDVTVTWTCTDALSGVTDAGGSTDARRGRRPVRHRHLHRPGRQHRHRRRSRASTSTRRRRRSRGSAVGDGAEFSSAPCPPAPGVHGDRLAVRARRPLLGHRLRHRVGTHTLTARLDKAGNETRCTSTYTVRAWTLTATTSRST